MPPAMTGWFAQNTDYLLFLLVIAGLWLGLGLWLHRTGRFGDLPKLVWVLLLLVAGGGWWIVNRAGNNAQKDLSRLVGLLVPFYVQEMQTAGHARLPDNPLPDDPLYQELIQAEINWLKLNPAIADIYTFRRRADGAIFLLVDSETDYDHNGRIDDEREERTAPGELYDGVTPALSRAFRGETIFDDEIITDRWGTWVSAFAPLRNSAGNVEAVLGVDFDAAQWMGQRASARLAWLWFLGGAVLLFTGPAVVITILRHDLRGRREAERQLREQAELRRAIFDQAPGGVALTTLNYRFVDVNEAFCRMLGYRRDELLQMTFLQFTHPDDLDKTRENNARAAQGVTDTPPLEKRYVRKDGSIVHVQVRVGLIRDAGGTPQYLVGQITDTTQQRLVESELMEQQKQLTTVLAHAPVVLFAIDAEGVYTLAEGAGLAAIGRQPGDAVGHSVFDRYAARPDILGDVRRALAGETFTVQREINGVVFETRCMPQREADGRITGMIGLSIDISDRLAVAREREKIEHKLLEVQKLESLGVLAGGVAHDFNNLLTAIMGNANLARLALPANAPAAGNLSQIEQASQLAAGLCQQLLAYAGRGRLDPRPTDLNPLVRETTELLRLSAGSHQLKFTLAPELPPVMADPAQIRQTLINIVQNAAEALAGRDGLIEVSTRTAAIDSAWLAEASTGQHLPPATYVCLDISDNGPGLDRATRARIFDPFFSTKGGGRGLGLAAALGIMRSHQGALRIMTEPGRGAIFTLAFPVHVAAAAKPARAAPATAKAWRGSGTVLIVDDEESVRATAAQMVAFYGFTVKQADSGQQAVDFLRQRGGKFDLVLLDLTMPGMDGFATFTALRQLQPEQRIVVFSGYSAQDARQRFAGQNLNGFLQKPFSVDSLREALQAATLG